MNNGMFRDGGLIELKKSLHDLVCDEYNIAKEIPPEERTKIQSTFLTKFYSWDKSDCSIVGLLSLLLWYVASLENEDIYRGNEYKSIIDFLNA